MITRNYFLCSDTQRYKNGAGLGTAGGALFRTLERFLGKRWILCPFGTLQYGVVYDNVPPCLDGSSVRLRKFPEIFLVYFQAFSLSHYTWYALLFRISDTNTNNDRLAPTGPILGISNAHRLAAFCWAS
jgi:hypothetical protein